jgi:hypothetical protein
MRARLKRWLATFSIAALPISCAGAEKGSNEPLREASGIAVVADGGLILVVSDEEKKRIFAVDPAQPGVARALELPGGSPKLNDMEALVPLGQNEVLAVTSHSRNKDGEEKEDRSQLALIALRADRKTIESVKAKASLRGLLVQAAAAATGVPAETIAGKTPSEGGLNVEGAALWREKLVLGLRVPRAKEGVAVLVSPNLLAFDSSEQPSFGPALIVPANPGEGVRDLASLGDDLLVLLGGSQDDDSRGRRLVVWRGGRAVAVVQPGADALEGAEGIAPLPEGRLAVAYDLEAGAVGQPVRILPLELPPE